MADPGVLTMKAAERIYLTWTLTGIPSGATVTVAIDGAAPVAASWDGSLLKILVAGATASPGAAVATLSVGTHSLAASISDTPELLWPDLGSVVVQ